MKLWQRGAFCSLVTLGLWNPVLAQDGFTVPVGSKSGLKIQAPAQGAFHSAFVDTQDNIPSRVELLDRVRSYENQTGLKLQIVSIQSNWRDGFQFPLEAVQELYDSGYLTLVRLLPSLDSKPNTNKPDPIYDLRQLANGAFDGPLSDMLRSVAALKGKDGQNIPVMISFAPEANGGRYRYSGALYGAGHTNEWGDPAYPDGPEIYRDAYRHIIDLSRRTDIKALNITWALHLDSQAKPSESWNAMANYYPGDDYIDWIGLSVLGAQELSETQRYNQFEEVLYGESVQHENRWIEFLKVSSKARKGLFKFGVIEDPAQLCRKADWLKRALKAIPGQFNNFKLVSYWNESARAQDQTTSLRLDTSKCAVDAYKAEIASRFFNARLLIDKEGDEVPSVEDIPQFGTAYSCNQDIRSVNGPNRLNANFYGTVDFEVYWIDANGKLVFMGRVRPGKTLTLKTTAGHAFYVKANGKCAGKVKIGLSNNTFSVG